jgi:hypothetical protein
MNTCLQDKNLGFANGTAMRQLLACPHQFGIRDRQDTSSEGQKDEDSCFVAAIWMGCMISGFCHGVNEICAVLGFYAE